MKVVGIILAAGSSRRFGDADKLLMEINGKPLIRHAVDCALESHCAEVHVITRLDADRIEATLAGLPITIWSNPRHADGIGASIAFGIANLSTGVDGALILPADMPWMETTLLNTLIERFAAAGGGSIVYPTTSEGEQRNPVIWPKAEFGHLRKLNTDKGGRNLMANRPTAKIAVKASNNGAFRDIDTLGDIHG